MLATILATATAKDGKFTHMRMPEELRFQEEEKMDDLAALAEMGGDEAGELIAWPGHFPGWPFPHWPFPVFPHHQDKKTTEEPATAPAKTEEPAVLADISANEAGESNVDWTKMWAQLQAADAVEKDVHALVADLGEDEAGEIIPQLLCGIPGIGQLLCGGMGVQMPLGRRRATGVEWESMLAADHDKQALVRDVERLVATVGQEDVGEAIGIICGFISCFPSPGGLGGGLPMPIPFGRRRASVPETSPVFRDVASLMAKLEGEDKMLVARVVQDQATMLHSIGKHEAGEIIGGLICGIPVLGSIICGGQQPGTGMPGGLGGLGGLGRRRANWETKFAEDKMLKDVRTLVTKLDDEDKPLVAKLFVDEAKLLQDIGEDEAGEGFFTALAVAAISAAPGIVTAIVNAARG